MSSDLENQKIQAEIDKLTEEKNKITAEKNKITKETEKLKENSGLLFTSNLISIITNSIVIIVGIIAGSNLISVQKEVVQHYTNQRKILKKEVKALKEEKEKIEQDNKTIVALNKKLSEDNQKIISINQELKEIEEERDEILKNFRMATIEKKEVKGTVFIQFRGSLDRSLMNQLAQSFQAQDFNSPGVERLAGSYQNMVRYFHSSDRQLAENVANIAQDFFEEKQCPVSNIKLDPREPNEFPNVPQKQVELWIHHSCS